MNNAQSTPSAQQPNQLKNLDWPTWERADTITMIDNGVTNLNDKPFSNLFIDLLIQNLIILINML